MPHLLCFLLLSGCATTPATLNLNGLILPLDHAWTKERAEPVPVRGAVTQVINLTRPGWRGGVRTYRRNRNGRQSLARREAHVTSDRTLVCGALCITATDPGGTLPHIHHTALQDVERLLQTVDRAEP